MCDWNIKQTFETVFISDGLGRRKIDNVFIHYHEWSEHSMFTKVN